MIGSLEALLYQYATRHVFRIGAKQHCFPECCGMRRRPRNDEPDSSNYNSDYCQAMLCGGAKRAAADVINSSAPPWFLLHF